MDDKDRVIDRAIAEEEDELLRQIGTDPGYVTQMIGLFDGRVGRLNFILITVQTILGFVGFYAAWRFFQAADPVIQLRWGLPAAVLLLTSVVIKMAVWPTMQTNRILRELKRLEVRMTHQAGAERR